MTRIAVVCRESAGRVDAIRDHAVRLADALRACGPDVDLHQRTSAGRWRIESSGDERSSLAAGLAGYDVVLVQYNPFLWGRWGFAPWLPLQLLRVQRAA